MSLSPATAVFCAQNGVANERLVSQHFVNTYGVCVMSPASYLEPGRVEVFAAPVIGVLDVGPWPSGVDDTARAMSAMLEDCGFASMATEEIETLKWGKLLSNVMNALEVLCGTSARDDELEERIRDEAVTCLAAHGVDVARAPGRSRTSARNSSTTTPSEAFVASGSSSWQSVLRGTGSIETDYLNGEIVALGRRYGIATPVNELLVRRANEMAREGRAPGIGQCRGTSPGTWTIEADGTQRSRNAGLAVVEVGPTKVHHRDLRPASVDFFQVERGRDHLRAVARRLGQDLAPRVDDERVPVGGDAFVGGTGLAPPPRRKRDSRSRASERGGPSGRVR